MTKTYLQTLTEQDLVDALKSGNHQSFEIFYERFSKTLYGTFINWVNDPQLAENLLQDAFVKAWINRNSYDPEKGRLFTWLYNIARNICIDHYRSRQHKKRKTEMLSNDISALINTTRPGTQLPDTIGIRKLLCVLRKEEKEIVELMYFKGFTQKEIAEVMGMPLGTVKTRMSMAIKNLRLIFANDWSTAKKRLALNN